jgi:amino-acid N-acetyltransferase
MEYKLASLSETKAVQSLLKENNLPFEDLEYSKVTLFVAVLNGQIIGCIGIEIKGEDGLLRSFAVTDKYKNQGIGNELLNRLINYSKSENIKKLHLLTTTADKYFCKKGFVKSDRINAPESIQTTTEFSTLCPSSSIYMTFEFNDKNNSNDKA